MQENSQNLHGAAGFHIIRRGPGDRYASGGQDREKTSGSIEVFDLDRVRVSALTLNSFWSYDSRKAGYPTATRYGALLSRYC